MKAKRVRRPFMVHVLRGVGGANAVISLAAIVYAAAAIDWTHFRIGSEPEPFVAQSLAIGLGCLLAASLWYGMAGILQRLETLVQIGWEQISASGLAPTAGFGPLYVYQMDGRQFGPVSVNEIQRLITAGAITENTLVSRSDESNWVALATHPDFTVG